MNQYKSIKRSDFIIFSGKLWVGPMSKYNARFSDVLSFYASEIYESHVHTKPLKCPAPYRHKATFVNAISAMLKGVPFWVSK